MNNITRLSFIRRRV